MLWRVEWEKSREDGVKATWPHRHGPNAPRVTCSKPACGNARPCAARQANGNAHARIPGEKTLHAAGRRSGPKSLLNGFFFLFFFLFFLFFLSSSSDINPELKRERRWMWSVFLGRRPQEKTTKKKTKKREKNNIFFFLLFFLPIERPLVFVFPPYKIINK